MVNTCTYELYRTGELGTGSSEFLTLCLTWYKKYMYRCLAHGRHPWWLHSLITCTFNLKWVAVKRKSRKFFLTWLTLYFLLICIYYYYYHHYHHSFLRGKKGRVVHKVSTVEPEYIITKGQGTGKMCSW